MSGDSASRGDGAGDRAGLLFCRCAGNLGGTVGIDALARPDAWPAAAHVGVHDLLCAPEGLAWLRERIRAERLDRIVIAACSPREHEATFRRAAEEAGLSPWRVQVVNLREQVEWIGGDPAAATLRAGRLVRAGLARVALHGDLPRREVAASPDAVVVGAGPAGLSAALGLAGRGRRVTLVERTFALGGLANQLDALFPEGNCASCAVAPAVDAALHHPEIEVLSGAEVSAVRGALGRFEVTVALRPRFVDPETCLGCPACVEACPVERPGGGRRAIDFEYPGCLPSVPAVDPASCLALRGGDCRACVDACAPGAVRLDARAAERTLTGGAIVLATGFEPGDVPAVPGVLSTWQLERMLHPNGPTAGELRGAAGGAPSSVLLGFTEGSAEADGELATEVLLKHAATLRRRLPGGRVLLAGGLAASPRHAARVRALAAEGVELVEGRWAFAAVEGAGGRVRALFRDGAAERIEVVDLAVLHAPSRPARGVDALASALRIATGAGGFLDDAGPTPFEPQATRVQGVFVAGGAAGPRPMRAAIRDGTAAAGRILAALHPGERIVLEPMAAEVDASRCCGCAACASSCPFAAVDRDPVTGKAEVSPLHCRACGSCAAACPTGAVRAPHATREQLAAEITALLAGEGTP